MTRLLPSGRIHGWSHAWFAGFPLYYFYFPLPAVLAAALAPPFGFEVAVKLVSVTGLLALPFAVLALVRGTGLRGWRAGVVASAGASFALMQGYAYHGGNVASTLSGEFSYALSFALSLAYLGLVARSARTGKGGWAAAAVLALTALSHVLTTFAVVLVSAVVAARRRRARGPVLLSWTLGFALSGAWSVPFLARWEWVPHIAWDMPRAPADVLPPETWWLLPAAALGAALVARRSRRAAEAAAGPASLGGPGARTALGPSFARLLALLLGSSAAVAVGFWLLTPPNVFPGRLLPYGFLALHLLAGWALVEGIAWAGGPRRPSLAAAAGVLAAAGFLGLNAFRGAAPLREWAAYNYAGYEARGEAWEALSDLTAALDTLPPGRVHWEDDPGLAAFGTPHALALLPYWTSHATLGGLLIDSSPTAPVYLRVKDQTSPTRGTQRAVRLPRPWPTDFLAGFRHLALLGVDYYLAFTPEPARRAADVLGVAPARAGPAALYRVPGAAVVRVLDRDPVVLDASGGFRGPAMEWLDRGGTSSGRWMVRDGPAGWPRVRSVDEALAAASGAPLWGEPVPGVVLTPGEVRFRTTAPGRPHLVAVSHFPNWRAEGASGPWWAAPSLMMVVPTGPEVRLTFGTTWAETVGRILTAAALLALLAAAVRGRAPHLAGPGS